VLACPLRVTLASVSHGPSSGETQRRVLPGTPITGRRPNCSNLANRRRLSLASDPSRRPAMGGPCCRDLKIQSGPEQKADAAVAWIRDPPSQGSLFVPCGWWLWSDCDGGGKGRGRTRPRRAQAGTAYFIWLSAGARGCIHQHTRAGRRRLQFPPSTAPCKPQKPFCAVRGCRQGGSAAAARRQPNQGRRVGGRVWAALWMARGWPEDGEGRPEDGRGTAILWPREDRALAPAQRLERRGPGERRTAETPAGKCRYQCNPSPALVAPIPLWGQCGRYRRQFAGEHDTVFAGCRPLGCLAPTFRNLRRRSGTPATPPGALRACIVGFSHSFPPSPLEARAAHHTPPAPFARSHTGFVGKVYTSAPPHPTLGTRRIPVCHSFFDCSASDTTRATLTWPALTLSRAKSHSPAPGAVSAPSRRPFSTIASSHNTVART
jgi:hypothetical protein